MFSVTNPKHVLLKANVPVARISEIEHATDASFKVEGYTREFQVSELDGSLVSVGSMVDDVSRTVPVLFQLKNPDNLLKIGMFAEIWVETDESVEAVAIPNSAIFDDNGSSVAYVHLEGESFAKRTLETSVTDDGYTQIVSGLSAEERVVTLGGYQVRLASLSTSVPVRHGHEH
ncbi:efflux RND transporter periplasmic adaptor subunit [bacterium]|nr:efflux RND transporter periplasmic adaptor subunit [bacterium]